MEYRKRERNLFIGGKSGAQALRWSTESGKETFHWGAVRSPTEAGERKIFAGGHSPN